MKRLIIPVKATITVSGGTGSHDIQKFAGSMTYLVIEGPAGARGRVSVRDLDETQDLFRDPKGLPLVAIDFYSNAMAIPLNGLYRISITSATEDGAYTVYYVLEERPTRV